MKKFLSFLTAILLCASATLASACQFNETTNSSSPLEDSSSSSSSSVEESSNSSIEENSSSVPEIIEPCEEHTFGEWETKEYPCATVKQRPCLYCDTKQTELIETIDFGSHTFGEWETKEYPCAIVKQRPCLYCDTKQTELIETIDFGAHTFDENTLCTTCGHQEFIQSEEYFEDIEVLVMLWGPDPVPRPGLLWWNKDRTFALKCAPGQGTFFIYGYMGNPVNVVLPIYDNLPNCYIQDNAFQNCTTLKSIYIPDTVTRIEAFAFDGCTALESVHLSKNLNNIGGVAFRNCTSLTNIEIPKSVRHFGQLVFQNCTSLIDVTMPPEFTYCDWLLFDNCPSIKTVRISKNSDISKEFFKNNPNCQFIYYD